MKFLGGWDNPPFEAPVEAGSEIELDLGGSTPTLNVNEHYGEDPSGDYYNLVEIRVTGNFVKSQENLTILYHVVCECDHFE